MHGTLRRTRREIEQHNERLFHAARQPHRRFAREEDIFDPRLECPLGRLAFHGHISVPEYEAGVRYRNIALNYLQSIGAPYPFPQSVEGDGLVTGPMEMPDDETCERAREGYFAARKALARVGGRRVQECVDNVAVYEMSPLDPTYLLVGLRALVRHFEPRSSHPFRVI